MQIKEMFEKDINRNINGVIKIDQDKDLDIKQELEEYVITNELANHFDNFYTAYENSIDSPTDKIGVWISGFFGSGKSHFLKILSYLLTNKEVAGKPAISYFENKFEDPMVEARAKRCASNSCESILFNIDNKSFVGKDESAILKVFARVFYEHLGFYGSDLRLAELEYFIDKRGKTEEFRKAYEAIDGESWLDEREMYDVFSDKVAEAFTEVMGGDEEALEKWLFKENDLSLSIDKLTDEIKEYINTKDNNFKLLFMVDEIGQYIGNNSSMMLNLQTIVEELGSKCAGKVWVVVTSQEAIDEMTRGLHDDFSKIQGRFNTRLSLSSSSVDEVIKRRILAKTNEATSVLSDQYKANSSVLKNLYTFEEAVSPIFGYKSEDDFIESYPFANYQFYLMPKVFSELRKHGSSGKHLSGGERSMLSGFQETAQALQDKDEFSIVPFWMFYDTLQDFLEGHIRRVINKSQELADENRGLKQQDVKVLKLLFLLCYLEGEIPTTISNIATLMADDMRVNKKDLRDEIKESLNRLLRENLIARNGDTYRFLTDEEQDIAREIANVAVDSTNITEAIKDIVYGDIFDKQKLEVGANLYPIIRYVDESPFDRAEEGLVLRIVTASSSMRAGGSEEYMACSAKQEVVVVLEDLSGEDYYKSLENSLKIQQYSQTVSPMSMPESKQNILLAKGREGVQEKKRATEMLKNSIKQANYYVNGSSINPKGDEPKAKIEDALVQLANVVYCKNSLIDHHFEDDAEIKKAASQNIYQNGSFEYNNEACNEVELYLRAQNAGNRTTSMRDVRNRYTAKPFGWADLDIAGVAAEMLAAKKVTLQKSGNDISATDPKIADYLRKRTQIDQVCIAFRESLDASTLKGAQDFYYEITDGNSACSDEDALAETLKRAIENKNDNLRELLNRHYERSNTYPYPGKECIEEALDLGNEMLQSSSNISAFLKNCAENAEDAKDVYEDSRNVEEFFPDKQKIFDRAANCIDRIEQDKLHFEKCDEIVNSIDEIKKILESKYPYQQIQSLPGIQRRIECAHDEKIKEKKSSLLDFKKTQFEKAHTYGSESGYEEIVEKASRDLNRKEAEFEGKIHGASYMHSLETIENDIKKFTNAYRLGIDKIIIEKQRAEEAAVERRNERNAGIEKPEAAPAKLKIGRVDINEIASVATLKNEEEIDRYVQKIKKQLVEELKDKDYIQISS